MVRKFVIAAASAAVIALSPAAFAQETRGTADEARAMLMKALAAVQRIRKKRSTCSTREKADSAIETSTCFV